MRDQRSAASPRKRKPTRGLIEQHSRACRGHDGGNCNCRPAYRAWVYDPRAAVTEADGNPRTKDGRIVRGKKIVKTFSGPGAFAAAKSWRADAVVQVDRRTLSANSGRRTVQQAADEWIASAEAGTARARGRTPYKPSVLRGYRADLALHILPELGAYKLGELRRSDVQRLADTLLKEQGLSPSRVKNVLMPLRTIYRQEMRRDDGPTINPTANLDLPADVGVRERVATPDEVEQLFAVLGDDERAIYGCAFYSGLRRGELQALRWSDVDLATGVLRVSRSWDAKEGDVDPKSRKGARGVPINGTLRDYLDAQKARTGRSGDDLVFGSKPSHPFTPSNVRRKALKAWVRVNEQRAEQGLDPLAEIGLHECRHSYVSWMFAAGHSLEEIGDYVGHSSTFMVDRYRHLLEGHERRSVARQDEYLGRGGAGVLGAVRELLERAEPADLAAHALEIRAVIDAHFAPGGALDAAAA